MKSTLTALLAICLCLPLMGDDAAKKKFEEMKVLAEKGNAVVVGQSVLAANKKPLTKEESAEIIEAAIRKAANLKLGTHSI